ncbi:MAG: S-methyl-5-thioribose-1-phosphate isomerase [Thermodesulfobacteriota bacterium]|nr:S-methyl-5-thioribose-1-phosphate isomerase [Thermodesulfobacteriota bacterium]
MRPPFFFRDDTFYILDQRRLPYDEVWLPCTRAAHVADAIENLAVRGAPAIGIAAAYGLSLEANLGREKFVRAADILKKVRPTAVNLSWAIKRVLKVAKLSSEEDLYANTMAEADKIWDEEKQANEAIASLGASLFAEDRPYKILTHCNTGTLATGGIGTALGIIRRLHSKGKLSMVYVDETRPLLQGARLTAYELKKEGVPSTLIVDNMAGWIMKQKKVDAVIVGADRIAKNLDTANKIGTYSLAVLAHSHHIPFYVAAPMSTFDEDTNKGDEIPIEERDKNEVLGLNGHLWAPDIDVYNPAFDVTPARFITAVITESKIFR